MKRIEEAIHHIHYLDAVSAKDKWINHIHPLSKLIVTVCYLVTLLSFDKYEVVRVLGMSLYCVILFACSKASIRMCVHQLKYIFFLVCAVGIANPFFDHTAILYVGDFLVTGGMVSMVVLMLKGIFAVMASYLLIFTTSIEQICYALRLLRVPSVFVTMLLLIYRYVVVLLKEAQRLWIAYEMRAPGQKGIHIKAWGPLVGQLLLRSMDRAQSVYESMLLRGFEGEFRHRVYQGKQGSSIWYVIIWIGIILAWRFGYIR